MPGRLISAGDARPLLDVASFARRGPGRRDHLSQAEIEIIQRTVRRAPEVMVKVLTHGGQNLKAVARHMAYLNRGGDVEIETDDGEQLSVKGVEKGLLEDWDLDLEEHRRTNDLESRSRRTPPKLVHKLMFSMPAGTPPDKVLSAVRNFAREELGLMHRYAMVLHTDEPHPHVHMVVKAMSEQGVRLHIRKATLRAWRREFARHLQELGVEANATERAVRGEPRKAPKDGIYRATLRGASTHTRDRTESVATELLRGDIRLEASKAALLATRREIERGWRAAATVLIAQGHPELAGHIYRFLALMPPPGTERELVARQLRQNIRDPQVRDQSPTR